MSLKIGFLAIGEGGSNIGEYAAQKGFNVVAVNSANIDLDKLKVIPKDCRIHLTGWEGAGRNRENGKDAIISHAEAIFEKAKEKLNDCDQIFVIAATAGGTGSGGLPIGIEVLSELKQYVGAITILPELSESPKARMNALECFQELSQFQQLNSTFIIDNEKIKQLFPGKDKAQMYHLATVQLIDNLSEICALTTQQSFVSNFDKNDLLEIINERGQAIVSKVQIPVEDIKTSMDISNCIRDSWKKICSPDIGYGQIVKAAVLGKVPRELTSLMDTSKIFEEIGQPYDISEAYYPNKEQPSLCTFYTVLSGLAFPNERLKQIEESIEKVEQELIDRNETSRTQEFKTKDWGSKFKRPVEKKEPEKKSLSERLAKFR